MDVLQNALRVTLSSQPQPGLGSLLKSAPQLVDRQTTTLTTLPNPKPEGEKRTIVAFWL